MIYTVLEGNFTNPFDIDTLDESTRVVHGPFETKKIAEDFAMSLIRKNSDNYYHRAWVIEEQ
jgi:hypothetical protein